MAAVTIKSACRGRDGSWASNGGKRRRWSRSNVSPHTAGVARRGFSRKSGCLKALMWRTAPRVLSSAWS